MYAAYQPLPESVEKHEAENVQIRQPLRIHWMAVIFAGLSLANFLVLAASAYLHQLGPADEQLPGAVTKTQRLPTTFVEFKWHTPWGSNNDSEADLLWNNINTAHGHVAVAHQWAAQQNWPPSMDLPGQPEKGVYLLEAYHQLHCLRIVRRTLLDLYQGIRSEWPISHSRHCFDALRQHIMCHADTTPLYGSGDHMAGDGQVHRCKSWAALRDYATENTACFHDGEPGWTLAEHFGHCDDGSDGL